jgi:hypothetical protein
MTSESKILTVSYGTFSCTLEGFDDPFNTMKAIAEYFRDLTADDRYFGAEPPQPDAAMLHRIAEREVSRLVTSKSREAGLVLRASKVDDEDDTARVTGRPRVSREVVAAAAPMPAPVEPALQDVIPSGVSAKLARLRDAVNQPAAGQLPNDVLNAFSEDIEDLPSNPDPVPVLPVEPVIVEAGAAEMRGGQDAISRIGELLHDPESQALDAMPADEVEAADAFDALEAASDLSGTIPDEAPADIPVVAEAPFIDVDATFADVLPEDAAPAPSTLAAALSDDPLPEAFAPEVFAEALSEAPKAFVPESLESAPFTPEALDPDSSALETRAPDFGDSEFGDFESVEFESAAIEAGAIEAGALGSGEGWSDPVSADLAESIANAEADAGEMLPVSQDLQPEDDAAFLPSTQSNGKSRRVSSRVVRIHPDDADIAGRRDPNATRVLSTPNEGDEVARLLRQADDVMADAGNRRRIDSMAHLKAAVAAAEADRAAGEIARPATGPNTAAYRDDLAHVVQPDPEPGPESEIRPRRKTVSVRPQEPRPGTIRPGMLSPPPLVLVSEQRIDRLVPVVEPDPVPQPASAQAPAMAPAMTPAALDPAAHAAPERTFQPLSTGPRQPGIDGQPLVAMRTGRLSGAIGAGATGALPIQPHERVALGRATPSVSTEVDDEEDFDEDLSNTVEVGLASFAERVGVKSMAEMLEAAAAYATCVEKRDQFTRPQLMRRLMASAGDKTVSREDGLRSFGTLLRTGRIEKVSRGHYVLAEHSPYLAEARRLH